jgi:hypothetical protein
MMENKQNVMDIYGRRITSLPNRKETSEIKGGDIF